MHTSISIEGNTVTAQKVGHQVGEDRSLTHRYPLARHTVVVGDGGDPCRDAHLAEAIKGDRVRGARRSIARRVAAAQHPVPLVVVEVLLTLVESTRRGTAIQASHVVVAHRRARLSSCGTTLATGGIGGATGHLHHGVVSSSQWRIYNKTGLRNANTPFRKNHFGLANIQGNQGRRLLG